MFSLRKPHFKGYKLTLSNTAYIFISEKMWQAMRDFNNGTQRNPSAKFKHKRFIVPSCLLRTEAKTANSWFTFFYVSGLKVRLTNCQKAC